MPKSGIHICSSSLSVCPPSSPNGLRQIRRYPPLDIQADPVRCLVSSKRGGPPRWRVSAHSRRHLSCLPLRGRRSRAIRARRRCTQPPRSRQNSQCCRACGTRGMPGRRKDRLHLCRRRYPHTGARHHGPPSSGRKGAECRLHREYSFSSIQRTRSTSPQRDERVLVVWSDSLDTIVPIARDFEDRLIRLLWRNRPPQATPQSSPSAPSSVPPSVPESLSGHSHAHLAGSVPLSEKASPSPATQPPEVSYKRTWLGRKIPISVVDVEKAVNAAPRPTMLFAPAYNGLAAGLAVGLCPSSLPFSLLTHNSLHGERHQDTPAGMEARWKLYPFRTPYSRPFSLLCVAGTSPRLSHVQPLSTPPP